MNFCGAFFPVRAALPSGRCCRASSRSMPAALRTRQYIS